MASFHVQYPPARRLDLVEDLFGHRVADPYRWLEEAGAAETRQWLAAQEELWAAYRAELPGRDAFAARVRELLQVGYVGLPAWRGTARFYTRRDPGQEHGVLYVADGAGEADDPIGVAGGGAGGAGVAGGGAGGGGGGRRGRGRRGGGRRGRGRAGAGRSGGDRPVGAHHAGPLAAGQGGAAARLPAVVRRR